MSKPIVAAQMYTCRDFCKNPREIAESLRKLAAIGYTAVQSSGIGKEEAIEPAEMKRLCDDLGLTVCATHISFDAMRADLVGVSLALASRTAATASPRVTWVRTR